MADSRNIRPDSSINNSIADYIEAMSLDTEGTLKSIDLTLKAIAKKDGLIISQSSLKDFAEAERRANKDNRRTSEKATDNDSSPYARRRTGRDSENSDYTSRSRRRKSPQQMFDEGLDEFEKSLNKALFGSANPISDALKGPVNNLAKKLNTDVDNLGNEVGKRFGKLIGDLIRRNPIGDRLTREFQSMGNMFSGVASDALNGLGDILSDGFDSKNFNIRDIFEKGKQSFAKNMQQSFGTWTDNANDLKDVFNRARNKRPSRFSEAQDIAKEATKAAEQGVSRHTSDIGDKVGDVVSDVAQGAEKAASAGEELGGLSKTASKATGLVKQLPAVITNIIKGGTTMGQATMAAAAGAQGASTALTVAGTAAAETGTMMAGAGSAAAGAAQAAGAIPVLGPIIMLAILAASAALDKLAEAVQPAIEGFKSFKESVKNASNRQKTQQAKNRESWKKRVKADIESMTKAAFDVMEDAAKKVMDTWDEVEHTVSATQGYDKEGVQALWSSYAKRLKEDNLNEVVSSADMMSNLESVLKQGLSGQVAEEFAYIATKLNAAVPTQDFFQYASTYASVAANAAKSGKSLDEALAIADQELEEFASNLLYSGRQIAGGFSSDLQNGSKLFEESAKIALTSRIGDVSDISGVLTSVSAIVSATAPDLADSIVSAVVDAATGGNSDTLTALRSMAGVGASNSVFLQELASNPQQIFANLFENLAQLQNMSSSNFMEVAEGLSSIFGISMDAFARVDFAYLADAIKEMNVNNTALDENIALLASGETTSTAEQLRMQKINAYMIEEGLAFVLDSEVGRAVQEHMWQEQLTREIEENTFAVELQGGALDFIEGIAQTVQNIVNFLNPIAWIKKIGNVAMTMLESAALSQDLEETVKASRVGKGTFEEFTYLFPGGARDLVGQGLLDLGEDRPASTYLDMLKGISGKSVVSAMNNVWTFMSNQQDVSSTLGLAGRVGKSIISALGLGKANSTITPYYTTKLVQTNAGRGWSGNTFDAETGIDYVSGSSEEEDYYFQKFVKKFVPASTLKENASSEEKAAESARRGQAASAAIQEIMTESIATIATDSGKKVRDAVMAVETDITDKFEKGLVRTATMTYHPTKATNGQAGYLTQEEIYANLLNYRDEAGIEGSLDFEDWVEKTFEMSVNDLDKVLENLGTDIQTVEAKYTELQSKETARQSKARELHEVQFWEDMQRFATELFPEYLNEWKRYYIMHEAYTNSTNEAYQKALQTSTEEKGKEEDAILKLANSLTSNDLWDNFAKEIADPTVQTNLLLAKILVITEAIMQQNNETSIVSVPTALSSLGLGLTTPTGGVNATK